MISNENIDNIIFLFSTPWITNPDMEKKVTEETFTTFPSSIIHLLTSSNINFYPKIVNLKLIPIHDLLSKYFLTELNILSKPLITDEFYRYKYNLIGVLERWTRTYNIKNEFTSLDILSNKIINYWFNYISENKINVVLLNNPHTPHDYTIYFLSILLKIKTVVLSPLFNPYSNIIRYVVSNDLSWNNKINLKSINVIGPDLMIIYENFINKKDNFHSLESLEGFTLIKENNKLSQNYSKFFTVILKITIRLRLVFNKLVEIYFLNLVTKYERELPQNVKYIYFPLHYQPEATTIPFGNIYRDQLEVINRLSPFMSSRLILVVKEHPVYWKNSARFDLKNFTPIKKFRSAHFYKKIIENENMILVNNQMDSRTLIKRSSGVVSVTGTVLLESMVHNKPALMFGENYYSQLPNVFKASNKFEISKFFKVVMSGSELLKEDVYKFILNLEKSSIDDGGIFRNDTIYDNKQLNPSFVELLKKIT